MLLEAQKESLNNNQNNRRELFWVGVHKTGRKMRDSGALATKVTLLSAKKARNPRRSYQFPQFLLQFLPNRAFWLRTATLLLR